MRISRIPPEPDYSEPRKLVEMMIKGITTPTKRDKQIKIGPSGIGDPCDHCVAALMDVHHQRTLGNADAAAPLSGNLAAWMGTAMHYYLEHLFVGPAWDAIGFEREEKLYIGNIPGYGDVHGSADAYSETFAAVGDYKSSTLAKIRGYKMHGVGQNYNCQRQLYGRGKELQGKPVRWVINFFVPRDGTSFSDIWADIAPYDRDLADRALARATKIFQEYVVPGKIDELGSDDDCYSCNRFDSVPASPIIRGRNGNH